MRTVSPCRKSPASDEAHVETHREQQMVMPQTQAAPLPGSSGSDWGWRNAACHSSNRLGHAFATALDGAHRQRLRYLRCARIAAAAARGEMTRVPSTIATRINSARPGACGPADRSARRKSRRSSPHIERQRPAAIAEARRGEGPPPARPQSMRQRQGQRARHHREHPAGEPARRSRLSRIPRAGAAIAMADRKRASAPTTSPAPSVQAAGGRRS